MKNVVRNDMGMNTHSLLWGRKYTSTDSEVQIKETSNRYQINHDISPIFSLSESPKSLQLSGK